MSDTIAILNPIHHQGWDEFILSTRDYSFFHSRNWARVLHEAYDFEPLYFAFMDSSAILAAMPCMEIRSNITGRRAVSLPFTDYCEPIIGQGGQGGRGGCDGNLHPLMTHMMAYGKKAGWKSIEWRGDIRLSDQPASHTYIGHTLDLSQKDDGLFSAIRDSTRRNINKAINAGVKVEIKQSMDAMREFYHLNCLTRREHGLPPQPYHFFKKVYEWIISRNGGAVVLASYADRYIAGALFFHFGKKALYKYGASDKHYWHLRANNLVMWEAIQWYARQGYQSLCFGRSEPTHDGLLQYKRGWGAEERAIRYYKYDIVKETFVNGPASHSDGYRKIFHHMPIPILRMAGSMLYKHIG